MPSYVIFMREGAVVDPEAMAAYQQGNREGPPDPNIKPLSVYGELETIEGEPCEGMVILEFPTREAAKDWYNGPYGERAKLRQKAAPYRGFIVDGL
ncbi:MAG: DUF1330 domain-containing protein [Novosphingobium sp.]|nr:DUF1330 domain-containing protein [Novosphingobium sp.]